MADIDLKSRLQTLSSIIRLAYPDFIDQPTPEESVAILLTNVLISEDRSAPELEVLSDGLDRLLADEIQLGLSFEHKLDDLSQRVQALGSFSDLLHLLETSEDITDQHRTELIRIVRLVERIVVSLKISTQAARNPVKPPKEALGDKNRRRIFPALRPKPKSSPQGLRDALSKPIVTDGWADDFELSGEQSVIAGDLIALHLVVRDSSVLRASSIHANSISIEGNGRIESQLIRCRTLHVDGTGSALATASLLATVLIADGAAQVSCQVLEKTEATLRGQSFMKFEKGHGSVVHALDHSIVHSGRTGANVRTRDAAGHFYGFRLVPQPPPYFPFPGSQKATRGTILD